MVGKLIKYDFRSFLRLLLPVQLIIIGIAAINRIVQIFETGGTTYRIVFTSSVVLLAVASAVALVMCIVIAIVRFYQGLYSGEGYLSQTLPVTPEQHIVSKLIVSMIFEIGTLFAIFIALNVAALGDVGVEVYKAGGYLFGRAFEQLHGHVILYIIEIVVMVLVWSATSLLLFYFCISIGQLANRKKILLAFGVYFGIYIITQIFGTLLIIFGTFAQNSPYWINLYRNVMQWVGLHRIASIHIIICSMIVLSAVLGLIYFLISKSIMKKHLNLT